MPFEDPLGCHLEKPLKMENAIMGAVNEKNMKIVALCLWYWKNCCEIQGKTCKPNSNIMVEYTN